MTTILKLLYSKYMVKTKRRAKNSAFQFNSFQVTVVTMLLIIIGMLVYRFYADPNAAATSQPLTQQSTGNGAPNGAHYNLNVHGVQNTANFSPNCGNGNDIFVPLVGKATIDLTEGSTFQVLDCDGVNGAANFMLPNPDPTNSGTTTYSVWVRALGKPGGSSSMNTCATDPTTGTLYCSIYQTVSMRTKGQQTFTDVSKQLLYIYYYNSTGQLVRVPLFDSSLQGYYWSYDNNGLKLLQMRFYPVSSTVPTVPPTATP